MATENHTTTGGGDAAGETPSLGQRIWGSYAASPGLIDLGAARGFAAPDRGFARDSLATEIFSRWLGGRGHAYGPTPTLIFRVRAAAHGHPTGVTGFAESALPSVFAHGGMTPAASSTQARSAIMRRAISEPLRSIPIAFSNPAPASADPAALPARVTERVPATAGNAAGFASTSGADDSRAARVVARAGFPLVNANPLAMLTRKRSSDGPAPEPGSDAPGTISIDTPVVARIARPLVKNDVATAARDRQPAQTGAPERRPDAVAFELPHATFEVRTVSSMAKGESTATPLGAEAVVPIGSPAFVQRLARSASEPSSVARLPLPLPSPFHLERQPGTASSMGLLRALTPSGRVDANSTAVASSADKRPGASIPQVAGKYADAITPTSWPTAPLSPRAELVMRVPWHQHDSTREASPDLMTWSGEPRRSATPFAPAISHGAARNSVALARAGEGDRGGSQASAFAPSLLPLPFSLPLSAPRAVTSALSLPSPPGGERPLGASAQAMTQATATRSAISRMPAMVFAAAAARQDDAKGVDRGPTGAPTATHDEAVTAGVVPGIVGPTLPSAADHHAARGGTPSWHVNTPASYRPTPLTLTIARQVARRADSPGVFRGVMDVGATTRTGGAAGGVMLERLLQRVPVPWMSTFADLEPGRHDDVGGGPAVSSPGAPPVHVLRRSTRAGLFAATDAHPAFAGSNTAWPTRAASGLVAISRQAASGVVADTRGASAPTLPVDSLLQSSDSLLQSHTPFVPVLARARAAGLWEREPPSAAGVAIDARVDGSRESTFTGDAIASVAADRFVFRTRAPGAIGSIHARSEPGTAGTAEAARIVSEAPLLQMIAAAPAPTAAASTTDERAPGKRADGDLEELTERVCRRLFRQLAIEHERRGGDSWR